MRITGEQQLVLVGIIGVSVDDAGVVLTIGDPLRTASPVGQSQ